MEVKNQILMVGCGNMADTWSPYLRSREDCEVVAVVDIDPAATARVKREYGFDCPAYTSITKALDAEKPNLVCNLTVPSAHLATTTVAFDRGIDVFSEKPISDNFPDAIKLLKASEKAGVVYSIMQNRRFLSYQRDIRTFLDQGEMGEITMLNADFFLGAHFGGFRAVMDSPLLIDMSIHTFDQARVLSRANAVSVYCHEFNPSNSWFKGNCAAICIFEMDNGAVFCYCGNWCNEGLNSEWECDWRISCEKGSVKWNGKDAPIAEILDPSITDELVRPGIPVSIPRVYTGREGHEGCLDNLFDSRANGIPAETDIHDNIQSYIMAHAAVKSAREGRKVWIKEMMEG